MLPKQIHFFPDFLIPWLPVFSGPLPLALSSKSFFALASIDSEGNVLAASNLARKATNVKGNVPALCFSLKARSSSSRSFFSFLAALRGLTLPPRDEI